MSTCAPWTLKNECANPACKHEKDSHHHGKDNCLVLHCDCKEFLTQREWESLQQAKKTSGPRLTDIDDDCPDTPRMPFGWP